MSWKNRLFKTFTVACALQLGFPTLAKEAGQEYDGVAIPKDKVSAKGIIPFKVEIYPEQTIKEYSKNMLGVTAETTASISSVNRLFLPYGKTFDSGYPLLAEDTVELFKSENFAPPFVQLFGGGISFHWKDQLGKMEERKPLRSKNPKAIKPKVQVGFVEYLKFMLAVNPQAEFAVHVNLADNLRDSRDLAQFLLGDSNTEWGKRRVELGIPGPVKVAVWNLDGEYEWQEGWTAEMYIVNAMSHIVAIRSVDPNAKISVQAVTAPWAAKSADKWIQWNRAILNGLGENVEYFSFHPYYHGLPVSVIAKEYMDKMLEDIKKSPNPNVKIFVSEYGTWPPGYGRKDWNKYWFWTHSLKGCLDTAEWLNVMMNRTDVAMMCCHSLNSGPWMMAERDAKSGKVYLTGIADVLKMYQNIPGERIVKTTVTGQFCDINDVKLNTTALSVMGSDGMLYLFLNNRSSDISRPVELTIPGKTYSIEEVTTLTAPQLSSFNTAEERPVKMTDNKWNGNALVLPPQSLMRLKIKLEGNAGK